MSMMIAGGITLTILGLVGLIFCIVRARRFKKLDPQSQEYQAGFKGLIIVNMVAMLFSFLGLALVIMGIILA
ncbi:hypothetical protein ACMA5I_00745 [Paracoccaceae bacterium GXU_MW_L88]